MGAGPEHGPLRNATDRRRLTVTLALVGAYTIAEVVGGLLTNSLALLADAGHMLSDVAALGLSLTALWIAQRPSNARLTYGYRRAEVLAALVNGATLGAISIYIVVEAVGRFRQPPEVLGGPMLAVATGGLAVNLLGLWVLGGGHQHSLNLRGAWLHVLTDALGSVGAIVAAGLIWAFGWRWADPAVSVLITALVLYSAWSLLRESVRVLMEGVPPGIDVNEVHAALTDRPGVVAVHDLHVWSITSGLAALSAHVVTRDGRSDGELLRDLGRTLKERFDIDHTTIQVEPPGFAESTGVDCAGGRDGCHG